MFHFRDAFGLKNFSIFFLLGGSSTTGNVVRKAFEDTKFMAKTFGLSHKLVLAIKNVWILIRSHLHLDPRKFYDYCQKVTQLYEKELPWSEMVPTLHKILWHGHLYLEQMPDTLTFGHFSEEPLESCHKRIRSYATNLACQVSKKTRLRDVTQRISIASDPKILSRIYKLQNKRPKDPTELYPLSLLKLQKDEKEYDSTYSIKW